LYLNGKQQDKESFIVLSQIPKTLAYFPTGLKGEQDKNRIL